MCRRERRGIRREKEGGGGVGGDNGEREGRGGRGGERGGERVGVRGR